MKKVLLIAVTIIMFSCRSETTKEGISVENKDKYLTEIKEAVNNFPKLEEIPNNLNFIFDNGYLFSDDIQVNEIAVSEFEDNKYGIILFLNENSNFKIAEKYNLGFVAYPENLSVLVNEKRKKYKSKGQKVKIQLLDKIPVILIENFEIKTKDFNLLKVYFYTKDGVLNDRILKIRNVKF